MKRLGNVKVQGRGGMPKYERSYKLEHSNLRENQELGIVCMW